MKNVWKNNDELYHFFIDEEDVDKQNELIDDLKAINDLIKNKIWIKKNY